MYIDINTLEYPVSLPMIKQKYFNISFPSTVTSEFLHSLGYATVQPVTIPEIDFFHQIQEGKPSYNLETNTYTQVWDIVPVSRTEEEIQSEFIRVRSNIIECLAAKKIKIRDSGFPVDIDGKGTIVHFDSDYNARTAYSETALTLLQDPTYTTRWKASDDENGFGVWVTMNAELMMRLKMAGTAYLSDCFMLVAEMETKVKAATTLQDLYTLQTQCQM